jgi:hypothetical protein
VDPELSIDIPAFDHDEILSSYLPSKLQLERNTKSRPVAAIASRNSARIQAQCGVFTIYHRDTTPLSGIGDGKHVWKYIVKKEAKERILEQLNLVSINRLSLFPELNSLDGYAKELLE